MPLSEFHPTVQRWFAARFGAPTEPQTQGWPLIRSGRHTLISAPTGTGKTLAGYLWSIDCLLRQGRDLPDETQVLYISPLRALSNDVQKNLQGPLFELGAMDPFLPEVRALVRTGDTPPSERAAMLRRPPHMLVTTPESLYILLTSRRGRDMLSRVRTVIVDEIHALAKDKRGSHLALSLERLEALAGPVQRIGLSATQKPLSEVGRFLVGVGRECELVDVGHRRQMDVAVVVPPSPLTTVCSHEQWDEIYAQIAQLIQDHHTTLVFVNTRKMAERICARLTTLLDEKQVACHHSSLSRERRLDAEQRLKSGSLRALVATASLELGIDIGDVDLVVQVGGTRSIATFLQRVGRSGHVVRQTPKGRLFPLTLDELVEAAALLRAVARGDLDRTPRPTAPLDILSQQIVAACVAAGEPGWPMDELYQSLVRAWPYRDLTRAEFDAVIALHTDGRRSLLHRDGVGGRIMARKRARITAISGGGAIPDVADYQVRLEPDNTFIGTLNEDFAIEANVGDIFQLGNASWRILKVERGVVRVADAQGQPPSIPFWLGEGPSRTTELSAEIGAVREAGVAPDAFSADVGIPAEAATQIREYVAEGRRQLGVVPTQKRVVIERFFDESGGMQMVLHAPFGGRINRAWGLALRKRFCRGFGFELQAAANEEAIVISLGPQHSFPLEDVFNYLHPNSVRKILTQAVLDQPMFESRWRWNATRSLMLSRTQNGKPVPPTIMRMRATDLLAASFPAAIACPENMPAGDLPIPMEHPLVRQTIDDCLTEATDIDGLIEVLKALRDGSIERVAIDTPEPSAFARGILNSAPYTFLDDAPLEERRTQAVMSRRTLDARSMDDLGALDPAAVERVRQEAWPQPESAEEVHETLLWMGFVTDAEATGWLGWLAELAALARVTHADGRWSAVDGPTDPKRILFGRLEALGPVFDDDPAYLELQREGSILRTRLNGRPAWCERRLLARIHRYTLDALRREIEPVSAAQFLDFLACWQHLDPRYALEGPRGVADVLQQLAGFDAPPRAWEAGLLASRVKDYRREWLDDLTLSGEFAWGRLWGGAASAIRVTPFTFFPREQWDDWMSLADPAGLDDMSGPARDLLQAFQTRGAMFPQNLPRASGLVEGHVEMALSELTARGLISCDSFAALRAMITPRSKRRFGLRPVGRWSIFRPAAEENAALFVRPSVQPPSRTGLDSARARTIAQSARPRPAAAADSTRARAFPDSTVELIARQLLRRTGVVFRRTLLREKLPVSWSALSRVYRRWELRGEVRGGRFVGGFSGEQFALPEAVELLRQVRREGPRPAMYVNPADPSHFRGILTPDSPPEGATRSAASVA